jgi:hypothetical protein
MPAINIGLHCDRLHFSEEGRLPDCLAHWSRSLIFFHESILCDLSFFRKMDPLRSSMLASVIEQVPLIKSIEPKLSPLPDTL